MSDFQMLRIGFRTFSQKTEWSVLFTEVAIIGLLSYIFLTLLAALFYPGGIAYLGTFTSELGSWLPNGRHNYISLGLFILSGIIVFLTTTPFYLKPFLELFKRDRANQRLARVSAISGVASSFFFFLATLFPIDILYTIHIILAGGFSLSISISVFLFSIIILRKQFLPNTLALVGLVLVIGTILYVFPILPGIEKLIQKSVIYAMVLWGITTMLLVRRMHLRRLEETSSSDELSTTFLSLRDFGKAIIKR